MHTIEQHFFIDKSCIQVCLCEGKGVHVQPVNNCSMPLRKCKGPS